MLSTLPLHVGSKRWEEREMLRVQTAEWWEWVIDRIAGGEAPSAIAAENGVRCSIFLRAVAEDERLTAQYDAALKVAAEVMAHAVVNIADDVEGSDEPSHVSAAKLRIETRLRVAGKWNRARYGDSVTVEQVKRVVLDLKFGVRPTGEVVEHEPAEVPRGTVPAPQKNFVAADADVASTGMVAPVPATQPAALLGEITEI